LFALLILLTSSIEAGALDITNKDDVVGYKIFSFPCITGNEIITTSTNDPEHDRSTVSKYLWRIMKISSFRDGALLSTGLNAKGKVCSCRECMKAPQMAWRPTPPTPWQLSHSTRVRRSVYRVDR